MTSPRPGVEQPDRAFDVEQRCHQGDLREHRDQQRDAHQRPLAREGQPGDRVGGHASDDDRDHGGDQTDADGVDQRRAEDVAWKIAL